MMHDQGQRKIDTHHHLVPPFFGEHLRQKGLREIAGAPLPAWTPDISIGLMDQHGIETAITSLSAPGVDFGNINEACSLARQCNEYAATLALKYPQRFGSFAVLPMPYVDKACQEAIYALDTLQTDGIVLLGSTGGKFLGDPSFNELMAELDKRNAVVFVHPNLHPSSQKLDLIAPGFFIEFLCDTTRAAMNLIVSGVLETYPHIRWILAHAGGFLPYVAWRISLGNLLAVTSEHVSQGFLHAIQQFYYDTALSPSPSVLHTLRKLVGSSHILFGSDFPFAPAPITTLQLRTIEEQEECPSNLRQSIYRTNALHLFPRYQAMNETIKPPSPKRPSFMGKKIKNMLQKCVINIIEEVRKR